MGNTIGTRIHIRNSQEYLELSNFYDPKFDMKYDQLLSFLSNEGIALSEMLGANSDKVELFTLIHILSKLDGGDELLKYSVSTNYDTKNGNNLRGFFTFEMPMFSINTRFPLIVNKFMTNGYKVYVDIPNSYKPIFKAFVLLSFKIFSNSRIIFNMFGFMY